MFRDGFAAVSFQAGSRLSPKVGLGAVTIQDRQTRKRLIVVIMVLAVGLLVGWVSLQAPSSEPEGASAWCECYETSLQAVDLLADLDPLDADYSNAIVEAQAAANIVAVLEPPAEIADDWSTLTTGIQPDIDGQSPSDVDEALTRIVNWAVDHCDLDSDLVDRMRGPFDR